MCWALKTMSMLSSVSGLQSDHLFISLVFQGLVNNTGIDWFMPWPPQALHAVAKSFLGK